jgi:hypothetical protein
MPANLPGPQDAALAGQAETEARRLEAALDRIAHAASGRATPAKPRDTAALATRLDRLIADLRGLLGT